MVDDNVSSRRRRNILTGWEVSMVRLQNAYQDP
jgi:hypothetical protein